MIALPYLTKPRRGEPCNGCGLCCSIEVCAIGEKIFGDVSPCPALKYADGRTYCELVLMEKDENPRLPFMVHKALGIGKGCCSDD